MHRCLEIREIQRIIFDALSMLGEEELPTLARLARTCRSFSDSALDVLWEYQANLCPLIQVMPPDLWAVFEGSDMAQTEMYEEESFPVDVINFVRELEESDWSERFFYYGRKIRELGSPPAPLYERVDTEVLMALSAYRPAHSPLSTPALNPLPNLRKLRLYLDDERVVESFPYMQFLLSPSITDLYLEGYSGLPPLSAISRICYRIDTLVIDACDIEPSEDISAIHRFICRLQHLRYADFRGIIPSREAMLYLSKLESLYSLRFNLHSVPMSDVDFQLFTVDNGRFANVRKIDLIVQSWDMATQIVDSMHCPFGSFSIFQGSRPGPANAFAGKLIGALMRNTSLASSLSHLSIRGHLNDDMEPSKALQALFPLRALQYIKLRFDAPLNRLDNRWLSKAAHSWPDLRTFILLVESGEETLMTLEGLIPLIHQCLHLDELCVSAVWKPFNIHLLKGKYNLQITSLEYFPWGIESPTELSKCLRAMFPWLERLDWAGGWNGKDSLRVPSDSAASETENEVGSSDETESAGDEKPKEKIDSLDHQKPFLELRKLLEADSMHELMTN
ncbi:hypothetical protein Hypma_000501 [Hypsizygus marmoreus]|uniref:F-box domain-containing protein n=1 Tax=Hypsizygus marmoreus TaxID=39966 RepID=A0A369J7Z6_HYPMA|nr:hypothetical protein Hypma_000501 [Hypsizygus marmoreus]